jgi:arylsulfatase A-like enzyme
MTRRRFLAATAAAAQQPARPNVVILLSDDQGYADIGSHEHPPEVNTPNLDRIAREGVRFTQAYISAYVCAPTRAGILTGRYQQRFGFYAAPDSRAGLPASEITLPDLLRRAGYRTGAFGKWHLGLDQSCRPLDRGFDEFYGFFGHGAHDYFRLDNTADAHNALRRGNDVISDTGYLTDNLARESVAFIDRNRARPFFLYLPFNAVHAPLQAPEADIARFRTGNRNRDTYLAMLARMDAAVGRVLDTLDRHGLAKNTLLFFLTDNGGARNTSASNGHLRDFKHSVYEGGIRTPFLVRWPARFGSGVRHQPVISLDLFSTICTAAGVALPDDRIMDTRDLTPLLSGASAEPVHDALFWDGDDQLTAIRMGSWKLVNIRDRRELYNLEADPRETANRLESDPATARILQGEFDRWRSAMAPRIRARGGA